VYVQCLLRQSNTEGGAVLAASRPYALAAAALAAVSTVVVAPVVARQVPLAVRQMETTLVNVGIENIPVNLFDDILNIPFNEVQGGGLASVADSFLFTGTWWVPSSTNLWGIDPGDSTHVALIDNFLPFPAFTEGFTNSAGVYEPGLNYEFAGFLAAEIPVSSSCDAVSCFPMTPANVITGSTQFDRDIGFFNALTGQATDANGAHFGLFSNWFQVPLNNLVNGYTFQPGAEPTGDTGIVNPGGAVNPETNLGLLWGSTGDPFEGGTGAGNTMPWDGVHYQLNLLQPFQTLYDSLLQTPSTAGIGGTGVEVPSLEGVLHTFENLEAGFIIDFDPFTKGSPACPALCDIPTQFQIPALVADIAKSDPSNTTLANWVADYNISPTLVNEPTPDQVNASVALLQTGIYNLTPTELAHVDTGLGSINAELPQLLTNAGVYTDPAYEAYTGTGPLDPTYGGYDPQLVFNDLITMFGTPTNLSQLGNPALLLFLADPVTSPDPYNGGMVDGGSAAAAVAAESAGGSSAAGQLSTDLSTLLASFGTTAGADALSAALAEMSAQFSAELANIVPQSLLSMF
jgi:hypothetical protein